MKKSRVVVLGIAFVAAAGAALLARSFLGTPRTQRIVEERLMDTTKVLVASKPIKIGQMVSKDQLTWQNWPKDSLNSSFIEISRNKNAIRDLEKAIARTTFAPGEPINKFKLIKRNSGGVMAAVLSPGMRAISTSIKESTSAGGFILPNDRVDVILSRKLKRKGAGKVVSNTILTNVRVLAIGQNIEQPKGKQTVIGKTATLELTLGQAETLARSESMGIISLALRSISESKSDLKAGSEKKMKNDDDTGMVRMLKFGHRMQGISVR